VSTRFPFGSAPVAAQETTPAPPPAAPPTVTDETGAEVAAPLPTEANLAAALAETNVMQVLEELDHDLIALAPVKTRIREIAALLLIDRLRVEVGLSSDRPSLHMSFTGNPGTGKTTVAMKMAEILFRLGYIQKPTVVATTRDDLVGQYVGHTAPKTKEVLRRAYGGVLFIDEAYYLYKAENERDYGGEAIEILLQVMEAERDKLVVIFAGYKDRMDDFFRSNPGLSSRVAHHIDFPDYDVDELMEISNLMMENQNYVFAPGAEETFRAYLERRVTRPRFAHGRSVRNSLDRARLRQANRLFADGTGVLTRDELRTITSDDILQSSVFAEDHEAEDDLPAAGAV
jgi:probable Rubsico expression protein CbbX